MTRVVVGGFGSRDRRDDAVGPIIARRLAGARGDVELIGPFADPLDLLGAWDGADLALLVDATRSGAPGGTLHVVEIDVAATGDPTATAEHSLGLTSTHGIGLSGALRLAAAVGRAPRRVVVVGVEGESFDFGEGLSPRVAGCIPHALRRVEAIVDEVHSCA